MTRIAIGIRVIRGKSLVAAYTALWFLCIRNRNSEMQYLDRRYRRRGYQWWSHWLVGKAVSHLKLFFQVYNPVFHHKFHTLEFGDVR